METASLNPKETSVCLGVVNDLLKDPNAWVFRDPVDPVLLGMPDYLKIVKKPMDLGTAKNNVEMGRYRSMNQFKLDVHLVFHNAILYDGEGSDVGNLAKQLREKFKALWRAAIQKMHDTEYEAKASSGEGPESIEYLMTKTTFGNHYYSVEELSNLILRSNVLGSEVNVLEPEAVWAIKVALKHDATPFATLHNGNLLLHDAASAASLSIVRMVYEANPKAISVVDSQGRLPLDLACRSNHDDRVAVYLLNLYPEARTVLSKMVLDSKFQTEDESRNPTFGELSKICRGIQSLRKLAPQLFVEKHDGRHVLHDASSLSPSCVVRIVLQAHPDAVSERDSHGQLPLHIACCGKGNHKVVEMLYHAHPEAIYQPDEKDRLPLELALLHNNVGVIDLLQDKLSRLSLSPSPPPPPSAPTNEKQEEETPQKPPPTERPEPPKSSPGPEKYTQEYFENRIVTLRAKIQQSIPKAEELFPEDGAFLPILKSLDAAKQALESSQKVSQALQKEQKKHPEDDGWKDSSLVDPAKQALDHTRAAVEGLEEAATNAGCAIVRASGLLEGNGHNGSLLRVERDLLECTVLIQATPQKLAGWCAESPGVNSTLLDRFLNPDEETSEWMEAFFEAGGPSNGNYGKALELYDKLQEEVRSELYDTYHEFYLRKRLALAVALELATPIPIFKHPDTFVDPVERFRYYAKFCSVNDDGSTNKDGNDELDKAFSSLSVWELRKTVDANATNDDLTWGREYLRNYRPDQIYMKDKKWRYVKTVSTDIGYREPDHEYNNFPDLLSAGGKCGPRAFFGRFISKAWGIPTWGVKQPGHAAMTRWTDDRSIGGWTVCLGAGWQYSWWNDDRYGGGTRHGPDFWEETQARTAAESPDVYYKKVVLLECLAETLGETVVEDFSSTKPWRSLALAQRKMLARAFNPSSKLKTASNENHTDANSSGNAGNEFGFDGEVSSLTDTQRLNYDAALHVENRQYDRAIVDPFLKHLRESSGDDVSTTRNKIATPGEGNDDFIKTEQKLADEEELASPSSSRHRNQNLEAAALSLADDDSPGGVGSNSGVSPQLGGISEELASPSSPRHRNQNLEAAALSLADDDSSGGVGSNSGASPQLGSASKVVDENTFMRTTTDGNYPWQTNRDTPHRKEMIHRIFKMLKESSRTDSPEWLGKLQQIAKVLEVSLYRNAPSFDAYMNMSTLKERLQQIARQNHRDLRGDFQQRSSGVMVHYANSQSSSSDSSSTGAICDGPSKRATTVDGLDRSPHCKKQKTLHKEMAGENSLKEESSDSEMSSPDEWGGTNATQASIQSDGTIVIPAASFVVPKKPSKDVLVMKSFLGGDQLHLRRGGEVEYELPSSIAAGSSFDLSVKLVNVHRHTTPLLVTIEKPPDGDDSSRDYDSDEFELVRDNEGGNEFEMVHLSEGQEVCVEYTRGLWKTTESIRVDGLHPGWRLKLSRNTPCWGLSIKELVLRPI